MNKRFEIIEYNDYFDRFEVNIYTEGNEEPETENLPAVYDPDYLKEIEERGGDYCEVFDDWIWKGKRPIIGFEYEGETILFDESKNL